MLYKYALELMIKLEMMRDHATSSEEREHFSRAIMGAIETYHDILCEIENKKYRKRRKKSASVEALDGQTTKNYTP